MCSKLFVSSLAIFCLIFKVSQASPIGVITDLTPDIVNLKEEVSAALKDAGLIIGEMYSSMGVALDEARNNVYTEMNKLRNQSRLEGDVDPAADCKSNLTESLTALNLTFLDDCPARQNFGAVGLSMGLLGKVKSQIYLSTTACLKVNDEATEEAGDEETRQCLTETLANLRKQLDTNERNLGDKVTSINNDLQTCLQNGQVNALGQLKNISDEFENCSQQ